MILLKQFIFSFPGIEKRVSLGYAREKIKARRKCLSKKHSTHETLVTTCEPLHFIEFWNDDEQNLNVEDDFTEDVNYSEDEDENCKDSNNVYSDEQGYKFSVVDVKDKTKYAF